MEGITMKLIFPFDQWTDQDILPKRKMVLFSRMHGWSFSWLVSQSVSWLVSWSVSLLFGLSVSLSIIIILLVLYLFLSDVLPGWH